MIINADHKGRTVGGHFTWQPLLEPEPDDFPPDSRAWMNTAENALNKMRDNLNGQYETWSELVWPGNSLQRDDFSWRDMYEMTEAALADYDKGERDIKKLAAAAWTAMGVKDA